MPLGGKTGPSMKFNFAEVTDICLGFDAYRKGADFGQNVLKTITF